MYCACYKVDLILTVCFRSGSRLGVGDGWGGFRPMFEYIENIRNAPPIPHFWKKAGSAHMFAITIVLLHGRHISIIMSIYK